MRRANYEIVSETPSCVTIRDLGPHDQYLTITNAAEQVVQELAHRLNGRRLQYYDSDGRLDQLIVVNGRFAGFAPGLREDMR